MGQITTTQNLVAIKEVRHAGQKHTNKNIYPARDIHIWGKIEISDTHYAC